MTELVAWEGKDFKAARLELFVEALPGYSAPLQIADAVIGNGIRGGPSRSSPRLYLGV